MKRVGHIWERFCSKANAEKAIYCGTDNKRNDRVVRRIFGYASSAAAPDDSLNPVLVSRYAERLVKDLEDGTWQPSPTRKKTIKSGGKVREIEIACLRDHIVQWMVILAIEDYLLKRMYRHSFGNLPGRGIHGAMQYVQKNARSGKYRFFVHLDIRRFYPSVDLDLLSEMFHSRFKDERYLEIVDACIYAAAQPVPVRPVDDPFVRNLAVGFYDSPWFANIYLDPLDRLITDGLYKARRGKRIKFAPVYARYVDDLLLMGTSASDLEKAVKRIIAFCRDRLHLKIKPSWEICRIGEMLPPDEKGKQKLKPGTKLIDVVGYCFSTTHTAVRAGNFLKTKRLAKRIAKRLKEKGFVVLRNAQSFVSHLGWFTHSDSRTFYQKYIDPVIDIKFIMEVISYAAKNRIVGETARIYCYAGGNECDYQILYGCGKSRA